VDDVEKQAIRGCSWRGTLQAWALASSDSFEKLRKHVEGGMTDQ